jgi:sulfatase maturation enzyme AslB (radical SAM superfamily)
MSLVCRQIFNEVCILGNGDVVCSCVDANGIGILGNIKHKSIYEIFLGKNYSDLRKQILASEGSYCPLRGSGCPFKTVYAQDINNDEASLTIDKIQIETFSYCNLRCPLCIVPELMGVNQNPRLGKLPIDKIGEVLTDTKDTLKDLLLFNYGEPFMDKRFLDVLRLARQMVPRARLYVHTNGTIVPQGWPETIVREELLDSISFSIDGASQNTYSKYRIGGQFDIAFKNMTAIINYKKEFRKFKPDVEWQYILFEWNDSDEELLRAQELAEEHGLTIRWIMTHTSGKSQKFTPGSEKWQRLNGKKCYTADLYARVEKITREELIETYKDLFAVSKNDEFLIKAYMNILGRQPDKEGFDFYLSNLTDHKMTKVTITQALLDSDEGKQNQKKCHSKSRLNYLETQESLSTKRKNNKPMIFDVARAFLSLITKDNDSFIISMYDIFLNREPDIGGKTSYQKKLNNIFSRFRIIYSFLISREYNILKSLQRITYSHRRF